MILRRLILFFALVVALVAAAPAHAQDPVTTTTTPTEPPPPPPEPVIAEGVTIAGVAVAGMTEAQARVAVRAAFDRPIEFTFRSRRWFATPKQLRALPYVKGAVRKAMTAAPGTQISLFVRVNSTRVRTYVAHLERTFRREPKSSRLLLRRLKPFITKSRDGQAVRPTAMASAITRALRLTERGPLALQVKTVPAAVTRASYGPVIVIRRGSKRLYLYRGMRLWRTLPVATGLPSYPTPLGRFSIATKARNPWWYPPDSDWAKGLEPVPPGPGNPLGTRWMGLSAPGIGIHGTPDAASIGYSASHGCIRMLIPHAEWLFNRAPVGTTVFIVRA